MIHDQTVPLFTYEELDSTNNQAMRQIANGAMDRALFMAKGQTAGRGQVNKSFYSPAGHGLYLTFVWGPGYPEVSPEEATLRMALLVARELEFWAELANVKREIRIKPINDLFLDERKIGGILWERFRQHHVIGIGLNLFPTNVPEELRTIVGTLFAEKIPFPVLERVRSLWERLDRDLFLQAKSEDERELRHRLISPDLS